MRRSRTVTSDLTVAEKRRDEWEISKLIELGVDPKFVSTLDPTQTIDLVKGLLYLSERYLSES
jgi:hypothetical protein